MKKDSDLKETEESHNLYYDSIYRNKCHLMQLKQIN